MAVEVTVNCTRVHGDRGDLRIPTSKLCREENVGRLGRTVAVPGTTSQQRVCRGHALKGSRADDVSCGRQGHDAYVWCSRERLLQCGEKQLGEQEMADVVGTKLDLEAFLRLVWWVTHGACIEDQEVQPVTVRLECVCRGANRLEGSKVQRDEADIGRGGELRLNRGDGIAGFAFGARGQVDACRVMLGQLEDGFFAEAGVTCWDGMSIRSNLDRRA